MSWLTDSYKTIKALLTPENAPLLPAYTAINANDLLGAEVLLFYGLPGTAATERIEVNEYGCSFHPPFHAALSMGRLCWDQTTKKVVSSGGIIAPLFHDVGQWRTDHPITDEFRSSRRIDVLRYPMTDDQRKLIINACISDDTEYSLKSPLDFTSYGIITFIHEGFQFVKPGGRVICSEDDVKLMGASQPSVVISDLPMVNCKPSDLMVYALAHPEVQKFTLWSGSDYHR